MEEEEELVGLEQRDHISCYCYFQTQEEEATFFVRRLWQRQLLPPLLLSQWCVVALLSLEKKQLFRVCIRRGKLKWLLVEEHCYI